MQLKNLLITISLLLVFLACSSARAEDPIVGAWEGTMYCGIKMNGTWYIEKTGQNKYRALAYGYAHPDAPSIQDNCTVDDVIQTQSDQFRFHTRRWLLQPAGYSTEYDTIGTLVDENTMDVKSLHPRCDKARFVRTNTPKPLPAACIRKAPIVYLYPQLTQVNEVDPFYKGFRAVGYEPELTCDSAQSKYRGKLLGYAEMDREIKGKQAYFAIATFLGYFSDDPVEMEEIAEKAKKPIDADFIRMKEIINAEHYFLFVSTDIEGAGVWGERNINVRLPSFIKYNWEENLATFRIFESNIGEAPNVKVFLAVNEKERYQDHTISVNAKEWRDKYSKYFGDVSGRGGDRNLYATRILSDENHSVVLAEIFDRKTGKSIVRWSPDGSDVNELVKLAPEKPLAAYNFNPYGCSSLNTSYFKPKKKK